MGAPKSGTSGIAARNCGVAKIFARGRSRTDFGRLQPIPAAKAIQTIPAVRNQFVAASARAKSDTAVPRCGVFAKFREVSYFMAYLVTHGNGEGEHDSCGSAGGADGLDIFRHGKAGDTAVGMNEIDGKRSVRCGVECF